MRIYIFILQSDIWRIDKALLGNNWALKLKIHISPRIEGNEK